MRVNHSSQESYDLNSLNRLYAKFSGKWHKAVLRLGYMDAYRSLIQFYKNQNIEPADYVLDVGTGTGVLAMSYIERCPDIKKLSLLDASSAMLKEARSNLVNTKFELQMIEGLLGTNKIKLASIDTLLCAHVIEHTPNPMDSLKWFHDVLHPSGTLLLSVSKPHWCTQLVRWRWGHKAFLPESICEMLESAGFIKIEKIFYNSGPPSRMSCGFYARKPR